MAGGRRIQGPKVVAALVLLVIGLLIYVYYRYYTVEPTLSPEEMQKLEERIERERAAETEAAPTGQ